MKIEKLKSGQTFKNYKELCVELGMEIKKSKNSREAQLKEISRYCKYSKMGHKFFIEEVYKTPLPKIENRGKNSIYGNLIQLLITDLLAQCKGHISISRSKLMLTIGMVNCNYSECRELIQNLSKYTEIEEKVIYDFYNTSTSSFKSIIETSLNSLMDKRVIMYNKIIKVSDKDTYSTRTASPDELKLIMEIEKSVLEELGYKTMSSVRVSKDWRKFRNKTKIHLQDSSDIDFYFTAYDITINEKYIVEERNELVNLLLEQVKRKESKEELNQLVYSNLLINAQNRHENAFTSRKMGKVRLSSSYVENFQQLADLLIDINTPNLLYQIRNVKLEEDIFAPELIDELDKLFA
ncbi:hypothetical protein [uncultured Metabacillus sp.]|uniref:hypothetical protein n=1 Tax=uncultured Metabacillus sp. TaxID=2860135 RepID=UPI002622D203|nr:hypothetical protein [uncultured Metabacillus sp.]